MRLGNFIMIMKQYKWDILFDLEHETYDLSSDKPFTLSGDTLIFNLTKRK